MEQENSPRVQPAASPHENGASAAAPIERQQPMPGSPERSAGGTGEVPAGGPAPAPQQVVVPRPAVPQPVMQQADSSTAGAANGGANPSLADDIDLIEKEWVDRAKQIVEQTRTDPYEQEKKVSELQADYLKKRYGKEVEIKKE